MKTNIIRMMSVLLVVVMLLGCMTGCANKKQEAAEEATEMVELQQQVAALAEAVAVLTAQAGTKEEAKAETKEEAKAETEEEAKAETEEEAKAETKEEAKAETKEEAKAETEEEAKAETKEEAKAETEEEAKAETKLEAWVKVANNQANHPMVLKEGILWVHVEDFLYMDTYGALIEGSEGGYALRAMKGVELRVYDDEYKDQHLVEEFDLPMLDMYNIVLTADEGETAFVAGFGNYSWANRGLFTSFASCEFAEELTSMPKNGGSGKQFYPILQIAARLAETEEGYLFSIDADKYAANYVPQAQPTPEVEKPEVEETEPEVEEPEKKDPPYRPGGGGHKPKPEEPDPGHNPDHNDANQEGEENTNPGHGDEVYDPEDQDSIPDLTEDPTEDSNDVVTDDGDKVEAGQENIPNLTVDPTEGQNDINTRGETSSEDGGNITNTTTTHSNGNNGAATEKVNPGHGSQVVDD